MPRGNRYFMPNRIWHITHRCHKREFLLKFPRDRNRWIYWLFEARKRYGLCVLNYCVTSNHIHLLVFDKGKKEIIKSMQLIEGRVAQEYNIRKKREGSFWDDRYHATMVDGGNYLLRCSSYIDFNMIRAGVVKHPSDWKDCGYKEIINGKERYRIINREKLSELLEIKTFELAEFYIERSNYLFSKKENIHEPEWSESIAVGSNTFVKEIKETMFLKTKRRKVKKTINGNLILS